jgi:hypothetical protein
MMRIYLSFRHENDDVAEGQRQMDHGPAARGQGVEPGPPADATAGNGPGGNGRSPVAG